MTRFPPVAKPVGNYISAIYPQILRKRLKKEDCMKRTICFVVGMTMVSCLILAGCKKAGEKAAEKAIEAGMAKEGVNAKVDASGGKVTIQTKEGTAVYAGGKAATVPENFPKDVYVYEGAAIIASVSVPDGFNLVMETGDSADKVLGAIKSKMTGFGWKEEMTMNQGKTSLVSYRKGERTATFNVNADKKTQITLTATEQKGSAKAGK